VELPNNHSVIKLWGSNFAIVSGDSDIIVNGDVTKVACRDDVIVGFKVLEEHPDPQISANYEGESGYFILRTPSGELMQGLSKKAFASSLKGMNLGYIEPTPIESTKRLFFGLEGCN